MALAGSGAQFDNLKIGRDNNDDGDLDDAGDNVLVSEAYGSEDKTVVYDYAGNMIDDGDRVYEYNAWNRLVRVRAKEDDYAIQTAEFDGLGRRTKKCPIRDTSGGGFP